MHIIHSSITIIFGTLVLHYSIENVSTFKLTALSRSSISQHKILAPSNDKIILSYSGDPTVPTALSSEGEILRTEEEEEFMKNTKNLCKERNIPFEKIKNARDLSSAYNNSNIAPNRVYRMGRVSDASTTDINTLINEIGIKTLIDLRSPTELKDDPNVDNPELFQYFHSWAWKRKDKVKDIDYKDASKHISRRKNIVRGITSFYQRRKNTKKQRQPTNVDSTYDGSHTELVSECDECTPTQQRNRYFVSMMNEFKYVKGTLSKLRKRDIAGVLLKSPGAIVSKSVREQCKDVFISEINDGGLPMLNELVLKMGASGIRFVLEIISDPANHPVAYYCTAGKDRTGIITAILLELCGVPEEDIVVDYSLSANVYAEMDDHKAMVGALSQRNLDPKTFLGAPPKVMRDTLHGIEVNYGTVENYLDIIGFDAEKRDRLVKVLTS